MANHHGKDGSVKVGAANVLEVKSFNFTQTAEAMEKTVMGDQAKSYKGGHKDGNGSLVCFWDPRDTTGQVELVEGAEVALSLYPEGETSTNTFYTGTVFVESLSLPVDMSSLIEATFSWKGYLTKDTVS